MATGELDTMQKYAGCTNRAALNGAVEEGPKGLATDATHRGSNRALEKPFRRCEESCRIQDVPLDSQSPNVDGTEMNQLAGPKKSL
ncbi:hypothetical protein MferCBS31731_001111 [Microsporum ferrugineum]